MKYYNVKTILFKNGQWVKHPGNLRHTYPFEYADAGVIHTVNGERLCDHMKWRHNKNLDYYMRAGMPNIYIPEYVRAHPLKYLCGRILWILGVKGYCGAFSEVGVYEKDDVTVYIYCDRQSSTYVSFYKDSKDTYILFGEGDSCRSILTNLLDNGYSDAVEQSIAGEIFNWCYENALTWVSDELYDDWDETIEGLDRLQEMFRKKEEPR